MMSSDLVNETNVTDAILAYEQLLNSNTAQRYHVIMTDTLEVRLRDAHKNKDVLIFGKSAVSPDVLLKYFKRYVKVVLDQPNPGFE